MRRPLSNIQRGIGAFERIERLLDAVNTLPEHPEAKSIANFEEAIEYRDVSFRYREVEGPVLQNIDLRIPKGKVVALVGASGAGKSTLVDLLPRFYDVTGGQILIDGVDVRELKLMDWRRLLGIVSQEAILFNDSIYNNIVFGFGGCGRSSKWRKPPESLTHMNLSWVPSMATGPISVIAETSSLVDNANV